ncbi:hypothetical protein FHR32_008689 [Streptosporangium album]|uniref:Homeodomain-like domain-containing protein n=1 Tax=Streptosporangium album TaxID=47479 RepID=A0A7W7S5J3_9ACTN|nr:hypothetical protein [Streptosporangium album]MBB4944283.1 hypothetical protein [Streptosporangium album]
MADSDGVAFLRSDVERFCGEIADLAPAIRLRQLGELRVMLEAVTAVATTAAMADARAEGWGLRRIGQYAGVSHEQVRRMLLESPEAPAEG